MKNPPKILELPKSLAEDNKEVCAWFGCGRELTPVEKLCGKNCTEHMRVEKPDIMKYAKFK